MKTVREKILAGEYWGKDGALRQALRELPRNLREKGVIGSLISLLSGFYSGVRRAKKELEVATGINRVRWGARFAYCFLAVLVLLIVVYPLDVITYTARISRKRTSGQYDILGTVLLRLSFTSLARSLLQKAYAMARDTDALSADAHELALPACRLMESYRIGSPGAEYWRTKVNEVLWSPLAIWPDQNQHCRVLDAMKQYAKDVGDVGTVILYKATLRSLENVGADQRKKAGLK